MPTIDHSKGFHADNLWNRLLAGTALGLVVALPAAAGQAPAAPPGAALGQQTPEQIIIQSQRPEDYRAVIPVLPKLTEPLLDTPQSITVVPAQLLEDRAITNLNDALRNVTGISIGAGEFSWQGNSPSIRGFVARNDMFLDGIRDFGSYYRDPYDFQQIEVLKGPASVVFGRGSTGGAINQPSKVPRLDSFVAGSLVGGTDFTRRATVDVNEPLPELGDDSAFRLNAMVHAQTVSGRNVGKQSRFGLAPSLAVGIGTPTRLTLSYFDLTASDVPDYGLPWFGVSPAPVPRQYFYGHTSDFLKTGADIGTVRFEHDITPTITIRNTARYAYYTRDFRLSEPIITAPTTTPLSSVDVAFNIWSGPSVETMAWDQLDGLIHFTTGSLEHTLVAGVEGGHESSAPHFDNTSGVPTVPLLGPDPTRLFVGNNFPRVHANTTAWSFAPYALDTVHLGEQWEVSLGGRWDYFESHYRATRYSTTTAGLVTGGDDAKRIDRMFSYRGAVVYKPVTTGSIYVTYGTSFNPSAEMLSQITSGRGLGIGNVDLAPEKSNTIEGGVKWDVLDSRLSLTASIFQLEKENARLPDPNTPGFSILSGTQRVQGFDAGLSGSITENWKAFVSYTYLDGEVTKSGPGAAPVGSPLPNTPKHSFSFFTEYNLGNGFEVGGGGQYVSSRLAQNTAPLKAVPGYWTFDVMAKYDLSDRMSVQLNVNNIFDKYYYEALHPWHVVPGAARTALLSLNFRY
jgi:catecholate siderophore receptor